MTKKSLAIIFLTAALAGSLAANAYLYSSYSVCMGNYGAVPNAALHMDCVRICGNGYHYDRGGDLMNGQERVCTRYPLKCGYNCTRGWDIRTLVNGTLYTCQEAVQNPSRN